MRHARLWPFSLAVALARRGGLAFLLLVALPAAAAQAPYVTLQGVMTGSNGTPLPNAIVNFTPSQQFFVPNSNTTQPVDNIWGSGPPSGSCSIEGQLYTNTSTTPYTIWECILNVWNYLSTGITLEHNSSLLPRQSLLNFWDSPASLSGGSLDSGYQAVVFKNDSLGGLAAETAAIGGSLLAAYTPPASGQYVVLYPSAGSGAGIAMCTTSHTVAGVGTVASGFPFPGSVSRTDSGALGGCPQYIADTWTGTGLPAYISPSNVTAVYGGFIQQIYCSLNDIDNCGAWVETVNSNSVNVSQASVSPSTTSVLLASGSAAQSFNYATVSWVGESSSTVNNSAPFGGIAYFQPVLFVYYTGTPPPASAGVTVMPPLSYNQGLLSLSLPFDAGVDSGSTNAYAVTLPGYNYMVPGIMVRFSTVNASTSSTPTLNLNGMGSFTIEGPAGGALSNGDIAANHEADVVWDPDGKWRLENPQVSGGGAVTSLTTNGTSGAASLSGGVLNIPQYQCALTLTTTGTSGAATLSGCTLNIPNYGAGSGGVTSLNSLTGALNITAGSNVTVTPSGSSIQISASGSGGGTLPANMSLIAVGNSMAIDDTGVLSSAVAITACSESSGIVTLTNSGTNNFYAGEWVNLGSGDSGATNCHPAWPSYLGDATGYSIFQVLSSGLSSTQFEVNVGSLTITGCASSCGNAFSAMPYLAYATAAGANMPSGLLSNTYTCMASGATLAELAGNFSSVISACAGSLTGRAPYLIIDSPNNDVALSCNATTVEGYYQTIFSDAHSAGMKVVVMSPTGASWSQLGISCSTAFTIQRQVDAWLRKQGATTVLASSPSSTQYWDIFSDVGPAITDAWNSDLLASNTGYGPAGVKLASVLLAGALQNGTGTAAPRSNLWFGTNNGSGIAGADGLIWVPTSGSTANEFQWLNASGSSIAMALAADFGYFGTNVPINAGQLAACPGGRPFCVDGNLSIDSSANIDGVNGIYYDGSQSSSTCFNTGGGVTGCGSGSSPAFSAITGGTNTSAAMLVGTGASLGPTGSGTVNANNVNGATVPASQTCVGTNSSSQIVAGTCSGGSGLNGTVTYTSSQTASSSDNGELVIMNCSSSCSYTLPATQPSTTWAAGITSQGSTVATITLGGSDTFNGSTSVPVLNSYRILWVFANSATSTDYRGDAPLVAGSGVTFTPASNGMTVAASAGGETAITFNSTPVTLPGSGSDVIYQSTSPISISTGIYYRVSLVVTRPNTSSSIHLYLAPSTTSCNYSSVAQSDGNFIIYYTNTSGTETALTASGSSISPAVAGATPIRIGLWEFTSSSQYVTGQAMTINSPSGGSYGNKTQPYTQSTGDDTSCDIGSSAYVFIDLGTSGVFGDILSATYTTLATPF